MSKYVEKLKYKVPVIRCILLSPFTSNKPQIRCAFEPNLVETAPHEFNAERLKGMVFAEDIVEAVFNPYLQHIRQKHGKFIQIYIDLKSNECSAPFLTEHVYKA